MCGLYASIGFEPDPRRVDLVAHRGPDGRGFEVFSSLAGPVCLGHRRLSIIDTSVAAQQPMSDQKNRFHIVFNGEIYNYIELREELRATGVTFHSSSDTEVLLSAFLAWGPACLNRLRGMFAFIIWDQMKQSLFAARDRFGIKPIYWIEAFNGMAFGSEIKQLLGFPGCSGRMNIARVHDFLAHGITDHTQETMFEGVFQLRPGEMMEVDASTSRPQRKLKQWYKFDTKNLVLDEREAAERFKLLLSDSVSIHLRSDVSVGSCLSGGLDSSSIVMLMAEMLTAGTYVSTFSACFGEKRVDEKPYMDVVAAAAHAKARFVFPKAADLFNKAAEMTWYQDEPFGSTSIFAQWCVFEEASRGGVKVLLDGQGADEQLAGYHSAFPYYFAHLIKNGKFMNLLQAIAERRRLHGVSVWDQMNRASVPLLPRGMVQEIRKKYTSIRQHDWLGSDLLSKQGNSEGALVVSARSLGVDSPSDVATLCHAMTFGLNLQMLLHWEDRNSMAHSVEARVPFLDHPLVEFSLALGNDHKIVGAETKRVLRRAMLGTLPEAVRLRHDKLGFATPEEEWFCGPLKGLVYDQIEKTISLYPDLLNKTGVRALRDEVLAGSRNFDFTLWRIISLGIWGETFSVGL